MKIKVSIIVPIYNSEKYLESCIDSILSQTLKELEIILVDDGSTDSSLNICEKFKMKDERIKIYRKENGGPSSARNLGIKKSMGEYIGFVDSDDLIDKEMYEVLYKKAKQTNADVAVSEVITSKGSKVWEKKYKQDIILLDKKELNSQYVSSILTGECESFSPNKIYRKKILKENNIFFPLTTFKEDLYFNLCVLDVSERVYLSKKFLYIYRDVNSSLSNNFSLKKLQGEIRAYEKKKEISLKYDDLNVYLNEININFLKNLEKFILKICLLDIKKQEIIKQLEELSTNFNRLFQDNKDYIKKNKILDCLSNLDYEKIFWRSYLYCSYLKLKFFIKIVLSKLNPYS